MLEHAQLRVKDVSRKAVTLKPYESLHDARNAMLHYGVDRVVLATEDYRPVGIITEKDIMRLIYGYASHRRLDETRLGRVMSANLITTGEENGLGSCAKLMLDNGISSAIVIDNTYVLKGICTKTDMVDVCAKHYAGKYAVVDFMTRKVLTVASDDTLDKVLLTMVDNKVSRVVVTENQEPVGIITEHDLLPLGSLADPYFSRFTTDISKDFGRMLAGASTPSGIKTIFLARDIMKQDPIMVTSDSDLADAARIMIRNQISGLPVVDSVSNDNPIGMITKTDVTRAMACILGDTTH